MASLRRSKTFTPDGQTARFLYTILKQLDLKTVDWNKVAGSMDITNGHAARMRYSRFKQHIEGIPTQSRAPRPKKTGEKTVKERSQAKGKRDRDENAVKHKDVKNENENEHTEANKTKLEPSALLDSFVSDSSNNIAADGSAMNVKRETISPSNLNADEAAMPTYPFPLPATPTTPVQVFAAAAAAAATMPQYTANPSHLSTVSMADLRLPASHSHSMMYPYNQASTPYYTSASTTPPFSTPQPIYPPTLMPVYHQPYRHSFQLPPQPQYVQQQRQRQQQMGELSAAMSEEFGCIFAVESGGVIDSGTVDGGKVKDEHVHEHDQDFICERDVAVDGMRRQQRVHECLMSN